MRQDKSNSYKGMLLVVFLFGTLIYATLIIGLTQSVQEVVFFLAVFMGLFGLNGGATYLVYAHSNNLWLRVAWLFSYLMVGVVAYLAVYTHRPWGLLMVVIPWTATRIAKYMFAQRRPSK